MACNPSSHLPSSWLTCEIADPTKSSLLKLVILYDKLWTAQDTPDRFYFLPNEPASTNVLPEPAPTNALHEPTLMNALHEPEPAPTTALHEPEPEPAPTNALPEPEPEPASMNALPEPEPAPTNALHEPDHEHATNMRPEPEPALGDAMRDVSDIREPVDLEAVNTATPLATAAQPRRSTRCRMALRKPDEDRSVLKRNHTLVSVSDAGEAALASKKQRYVDMLYGEDTADCTTSDQDRRRRFATRPWGPCEVED